MTGANQWTQTNDNALMNLKPVFPTCKKSILINGSIIIILEFTLFFESKEEEEEEEDEGEERDGCDL